MQGATTSFLQPLLYSISLVEVVFALAAYKINEVSNTTLGRV
jgi:hypothetical protein